eukprot:7378782-Prymnesium_polylepis.1
MDSQKWSGLEPGVQQPMPPPPPSPPPTPPGLPDHHPEETTASNEASTIIALMEMDRKNLEGLEAKLFDIVDRLMGRDQWRAAAYVCSACGQRGHAADRCGNSTTGMLPPPPPPQQPQPAALSCPSSSLESHTSATQASRTEQPAQESVGVARMH